MRATDKIHITRTQPGETVLEASNVNVERGGKTLLSDVSITLRAGEVLALLGPNGAGKSTLLSLLSGDVTPDSGTVSFQGKKIDDWSLLELSRRRSVLLQENQVLFPFTVHQVIEMGRAPWRKTPQEYEDNSAIADAIAAADVGHLGSRRVPSLSGGERGRVTFARVLAGQTGVLMLDEPTAALDLGHQEALLRMVRERAQAGDAVLIVLHDLNLAAAYADRIALLRRGEVVICDEPQRVLTTEIVSDVYETPVEIIRHPETGAGYVVPVRSPAVRE